LIPMETRKGTELSKKILTKDGGGGGTDLLRKKLGATWGGNGQVMYTNSS